MTFEDARMLEFIRNKYQRHRRMVERSLMNSMMETAVTDTSSRMRGVDVSVEYVDEISPDIDAALNTLAGAMTSRPYLTNYTMMPVDALHVNEEPFVLPEIEDEDTETEVTDKDIETSRYKIFLGSSEDDFSINYELDRFRDKLGNYYTPIITSDNDKVAPIVKAWSLFHTHALLELNNLSILSNFLRDLDNRQDIIVAAYVFGELNYVEEEWLKSHYATKRIEWVKVETTGVKYRKTK